MARPKNLSQSDEVVQFPGYTEYIVEIGDLTIARVIQEPGWVYSRDMATVDEGRWCEAHHVGVTISGRQGVVLRDGSRLEFGPDDVYDIPPGHDGYTIGDEPAVMIEWSGPRIHGVEPVEVVPLPSVSAPGESGDCLAPTLSRHDERCRPDYARTNPLT